MRRDIQEFNPTGTYLQTFARGVAGASLSVYPDGAQPEALVKVDGSSPIIWPVGGQSLAVTPKGDAAYVTFPSWTYVRKYQRP